MRFPHTLKNPALFKTQPFINNSWIGLTQNVSPGHSTASGSFPSNPMLQVHNPASGALLAEVQSASVSDVHAAINAAHAALPTLRKMTGRERANLLSAWHRQIADNADDLATLITAENGKPIADAKGEVAYANSFMQWFAEEAPRLNGQNLLSSTLNRRIFAVREPVGVAAIITPWNFPLAMITRKIAPALAAGCPVVVKSPSETPLTANALAKLALKAGLPPGALNLLTANAQDTPKVGEALCTSELVRKLSFTGSTSVGKLLMRQSASTLKKLSFELGGNAPLIIFNDADLDLAVSGAVASKFRSSGQTCVCANRIYVQRGIYDAFVAKFVAQVVKFKVGNGFDQGVTHGPLIHARAVNKVESHVRDAVSKGAKVVLGGHRLHHLGPNFFAPTVLADVTADMLIAQEETFGPVAGLFSFDTEEEVIKLANATSVGLAGYFFSKDISRCYRVAEALEVGMVGVNTGLISDAASPFGGVKESGFGREGSSLGIDEYTTVKSVTIGGIAE